MEEKKEFIKSCVLEKLQGHGGAVTALAAASQIAINKESFYSGTNFAQGVIASASEDSTVRLWDTRIGKGVIRVSDEAFSGNTIASLCFSPDALSLFAACGNTLLEIDLRKASVLMSKQSKPVGEHRDEVNKVLTTADRLISCDDAGEVHIRKVGEGSPLTVLKERHDNICYTVDAHSKYPNELISGGLDCTLVKWNISTPPHSKQLNFSKVIFEHYDRSVQMCNPPHVYSVLYDLNAENYLAALGNGAVCVVNRKKMKISCYTEVHRQRIVDAVLSPKPELPLYLTASNDLQIGLSLYKAKEHILTHHASIAIQNAPNGILLDFYSGDIYVADVSSSISRIQLKL